MMHCVTVICNQAVLYAFEYDILFIMINGTTRTMSLSIPSLKSYNLTCLLIKSVIDRKRPTC